ncbi:MAB_1171c family putative transporter [Kibdelosporangium phytohabitans]|uniref:DUF6545 domain-containing protein n=1 Tax=Kibdelosporangium phytohabitans TaxID=860235 RepID=A0A0N9IBP6_9PSEU|nr:MAB_1171c family putative transporter [Kibdelosporangium phytohabitans]ALG11910.1 hypothetical protein AOZ06_38110 [Kibdelosporangium phytohabitans]MBE1463361.1 hypothetical protein [Kibdelosporangium phytohabitans]
MDVELAIRWAKAAVVCAVTVWEVVQLTRRPKDVPLRILVTGLVLLSITATIGIRTPLLDPIQDFFGSSWIHITNACWMSMAYCWAVYFLLVNDELSKALRKRKALIELGVLVTAIVVMVVVKEISIDGIQRPARNPARFHDWERTAWYVSVGGYGLFAWFLGAFRAMAMRRKLTNPWARAAFWIVVIGAVAMAIGVDAVTLTRQLVRQFDTSFDPDWLTQTYSIGQLGGQFVLALGLALAPLAAIAAGLRTRYERRQRARYTERMLPLWRTLTTEFPYVALGGEHDFDRVSTEITDGLSELARDCPRPDGDPGDPRVAADAIAAGLTRRADRRQARDGGQWAGDDLDTREPPYPRLEPDFPGWRDRAEWMAKVADDLRTRGVIGEDEYESAAPG